MTAVEATPGPPDERDDYFGEHHVYEPHRIGLPSKLSVYVAQLWRRRQFVWELARSSLRAQNYQNVFGQLWLVLNPLLNAAVYFLLVDIIRGGNHPDLYFPHLLAGLFAYYYVSGCISQGAGSVVGGGKLILNTSFPRLLLPISQIVIAFMRFLPTLVVFAFAHTLKGIPVTPVLLWTIPIFVLMTMFAAGVSFFFATLQVYFRDTASLLPYILRIGLYVSPVLWFLEDAHGKLKIISIVNPLAPIFGAWSDVLVKAQAPSAEHMLLGLAFALTSFLIGSLFFMSREREFAVRL